MSTLLFQKGASALLIMKLLLLGGNVCFSFIDQLFARLDFVFFDLDILFGFDKHVFFVLELFVLPAADFFEVGDSDLELANFVFIGLFFGGKLIDLFAGGVELLPELIELDVFLFGEAVLLAADDFELLLDLLDHGVLLSELSLHCPQIEPR